MKCRACILVTLCWLSLSHSSFAQGTAFTYQGQLMDAGQPANGIYDMEFTVYKVPTGGIIAGGPLVDANVAVSNGLFTATLDFGDIVFNGSPRWLQIAVRSNGVAAPRYGLTPRQSLLPTPYAIRAGSVTGPITGNQIAAGTIGSAQLAPGAASQNLMASGQSGVAGGGVVLSESLDAPNLIQAGYSKVGTVDLAAEAWIPRSGPGPAARSGFSTVWTGSEYIIWGGLPYVNTGARYG